MPEIKETLLQKRFIDSSIELAKIQMDEDLRQEDKDLRMNQVWRDFKRFIYDNYTPN